MIEQQALLMAMALTAFIALCLTALFIGSSIYKNTLLMFQCDHWLVKLGTKVSSFCVLALAGLIIVGGIFHIPPEEVPYLDTLIQVMMVAIAMTSLSAIIINGNKKKAI